MASLESFTDEYNDRGGVHELALFAGIGGGILGGKLCGFRTVCYVEKEPYCVKVLKARIRDGIFDDAPIWDDVRTFEGKPWSGLVDVITAGFPCQPFSVAGKQRAEKDERNMWPDTIRVIREVRPRYAFLENVPALLAGSHAYFGRILGDLAESGYDARWRIVSAADVGAPHLRKRLWIKAQKSPVAYPDNAGLREQRQPVTVREEQLAAECSDIVVNADSQRLSGLCAERQGIGEGVETEIDGAGTRNDKMADPQSAEGWRVFKPELQADAGAGCRWWDADPADAEDAAQSQMGRVVDGIPDRVERLRAIGNAQVPLVAATAWRLLNSA